MARLWIWCWHITAPWLFRSFYPHFISTSRNICGWSTIFIIVMNHTFLHATIRKVRIWKTWSTSWRLIIQKIRKTLSWSLWRYQEKLLLQLQRTKTSFCTTAQGSSPIPITQKSFRSTASRSTRSFRFQKVLLIMAKPRTLLADTYWSPESHLFSGWWHPCILPISFLQRHCWSSSSSYSLRSACFCTSVTIWLSVYTALWKSLWNPLLSRQARLAKPSMNLQSFGITLRKIPSWPTQRHIRICYLPENPTFPPDTFSIRMPPIVYLLVKPWIQKMSMHFMPLQSRRQPLMSFLSNRNR